MIFDELMCLNEKLIHEGYAIRLLDPVPPGIKQRGQICKLVALSCGMHYLFQRAPNEYPTPPYPNKFAIRQNHSPERYADLTSLRELAKSLGSKVGEIYNLNHLIELGKQTGFNDFHYQSYDSANAYRNGLIEAIDHGIPSNVFFDVDIQTGLPINNSSKTEHAALVIGYAQHENDTKMILLTWDKYVAVDVVTLYQSSMQLDLQRKPETFTKLTGFWKNTEAHLFQENNKHFRQASVPAEDAISLRGKILYLARSIKAEKKEVYHNKMSEQLINESPVDYLKLLDSSQQNKTSYLPLELVVHFFEIASLFPGRYSAEIYTQFARDFSFKDEIIKLCSQEFQTKISGSLIDDIHRQNPDTKRSIIELTSNACDSGARRVTVTVGDGYYQVQDDGLGMSPEVIFNQLLIPKSSKKTVGDFIGRFGIGFYTCLAHLKNEQSSVVIRTRASGHDGYEIHFRFHDNHIEMHTRALLDKSTTIGTEIVVVSPEIKKTDFLSYVRQAFPCAKADLLVINEEKSQLSNQYKRYQHNGLEIFVATQTNIRGLRTVISHVLISEESLPKQSNSLDVIWMFPATTNITESRNQIQIDNQATIDAIIHFINMLDLLPKEQQIAYLNSICAGVIKLKNSDVHVHLLKTVSRLLGNNKAIIDHNDYQYLKNANTVSIQRGIIPNNWREKLGFNPPEWSSLKVDVIVVDNLSEENQTFYDDIEQTLYFSKALYDKARAQGFDQGLLIQLTNMMVGAGNGSWNFKPKKKAELFTTKQSLNFEESKVPRHHELYCQHGVLFNVDEKKLDGLSADSIATLMAAPTLIARYPYRNKIQSGNFCYNMDTTGWMGLYFYELVHQGETYFVRSICDTSWSSTLVYNKHFEPITGDQGKFLVAVMREKLHQHRRSEKEIVIDKWVIEKASEISSRLLELPSRKIIKDNLPYYSYCRPIEGSPHYVITSYSIYHNSMNFSEPENQLFLSSGKLVETISGELTIMPFNEGFLSCAQYKIRLHDKDLKVLSEVRAPNYKNYQGLISVKTLVFNGMDLLMINTGAEWLAIEYDRKKQTLNNLAKAKLLGTNPFAIIIENSIFWLNGAYVENGGEILLLNNPKKDNLNSNSNLFSRFVVYQENSERILITANGKKWIINSELNLTADCEIEANETFCAIQFSNDKKAILLFQNKEIKPKECKKIEFTSSFDGDFALIDGEHLLNEQGNIILNFNSLQVEKSTKIAAELNCPYLICYYKINGERFCILLDKLGQQIRPEKFKVANFRKNEKNWVIDAYDGKSQIMLHADGIIKIVDDRNYFLKSDYRYLWLNQRGEQFNNRDSNRPSISNDAHYSPKQERENWSNFECAPMFYRFVGFDLLCDEHVINNLKLLNRSSLEIEDYGHHLRFVDCEHSIFAVMYPYLNFFTHTPSREEFRNYFEYHNLVLAQDSSFIKKAMRLIDIIYESASNNSNIRLAKKINEITQVYGVGYLYQLYEFFTREKHELNYHVNYSDKSVFDYLAPLPAQVRDVAFYLFNDSLKIFAKNDSLPLLATSFNGAQYSILDLIVVASLNSQILQNITNPDELTVLIRKINTKVDTTLPLRNLRHAIYHLNNSNNQIYLREFIQNALDASQSNMEVNIDLLREGDTRHVTRVTDMGVGMDLQTILSSLIVPGVSTKRGKKEFIGGRGVGFFSAFIGAELLTLKTSTGQGVTYYFQFQPVLNNLNRIEDIRICFNVTNENFKGTVIERVSRTSNVELDAAIAMNASRIYARFVDANKIKINLNGTQINQRLELIGTCNLEQIGSATIYVNAECAFTVGGLFVRNIDSEYWECVPNFIRRELQKVGIIIDLPSSVCLTRERNNFYAADKFILFFKPMFFFLCFNAYCHLLQAGKIKPDYLPYDLLEKIINQPNVDISALHDIQRINRGELITNYKRYLNYYDCLDFLTHIKFISYGERNRLSIADIAFYSRKSQLQKALLPNFIRRYLDRISDSIQYTKEQKSFFDETENNFEQQLKQFESHSWPTENLATIPDAANWNLFRTIMLDLLACISQKFNWNLTLRFSTQYPNALAWVRHGRTEININPVLWSATLNSIFRVGEYRLKENITKLLQKLVNTLSHEVTHLIEHSCCNSETRSYTHDKAFRDIHANTYAFMMMSLNATGYLKHINEEILKVEEKLSGLKRIPNCKDLMIMQLLGNHDYMRELEDAPSMKMM